MENTQKKCRKYLSLDGMINIIKDIAVNIVDSRAKNKKYHILDAVMSCFAMFSLKEPSLLSFNRKIHEPESGNLKRIFKLDKLMSDTQMRRILDIIDDNCIDKIFKAIISKVQRGKILESFYNKTLGSYLAASDGSQFFSSTKRFNDNCTVKNHSNGTQSYSLSILTTSIVKPGDSNVIPLCPEVIRKQDGVKKNDCEMNAFKRHLKDIKKTFPKLKFTFLLDALYSVAPVIRAITQQGYQFIISIQPDSHEYLYAMENECTEYEISTKKIKYKFKYKNNVSLNASNLDEKVNVIFFEETKKGKPTKFSWITSHKVTKKNIMEIMKAGRTRWKIENETFNTLKNQGYNMEHSYGLGNKNLAAVLIKTMMLAFLVDQIQKGCCRLFQEALRICGTQIALWETIRSTYKFFILESMEIILKMIVYRYQVKVEL
jgi:hypothetical protein